MTQVNPQEIVPAVLAQMTLQEKIGQLTMQAADHASTGPPGTRNLIEAVKAARVGSILNLWGRERISVVQRVAVEESRLGIPPIQHAIGRLLTCRFSDALSSQRRTAAPGQESPAIARSGYLSRSFQPCICSSRRGPTAGGSCTPDCLGSRETNLCQAWEFLGQKGLSPFPLYRIFGP